MPVSPDHFTRQLRAVVTKVRFTGPVRPQARSWRGQELAAIGISSEFSFSSGPRSELSVRPVVSCLLVPSDLKQVRGQYGVSALALYSWAVAVTR